MVQQSNYPNTESELHTHLDELYYITCQALVRGQLPRHKNLLEVMSSEMVILSAIHRIKANKGCQTAGSDKEIITVNILQRDYQEIISRVQTAFRNYSPNPVRRVWIPKPGKQEKRPLGIPALIDRIIQECVRIVIDPILEAQFFKHSYGFRPMRDAKMALERITNVVHDTGYHWIVEGDISKFFDHVNHTTLLKKLWHLGIRDRRVLMIIKQMLKAGIMGEVEVNPMGTPQGGILSPLLANAYLHTLDQWIVREWEEKKTARQYTQNSSKRRMMKKESSLKPAYFVRYADDWVLITSTKSNAEKWKKRISRYLALNLKLTLSEEKTLITNVRNKQVKFVGYEYKLVNGKSKSGYVTRTRPNRQRLTEKVKEIHQDIKQIRKIPDREKLIHRINLVNAKIRGIIQYYETATAVSCELGKYANALRYAAFKTLKGHGGKWLEAKAVKNLSSVHSNYGTYIPAIEYKGSYIGLTSLSFCKWMRSNLKNPKETPYTQDGRYLFYKRTGQRQLRERADDLLSLHLSEKIAHNFRGHALYNFEYFLNRPYAYNRDRGRCRVCGYAVQPQNVEFHHTSPHLPPEVVNRVNRLATVHKSCHKLIHSNNDYSYFGVKIWSKILKFREKLTYNT